MWFCANILCTPIACRMSVSPNRLQRNSNANEPLVNQHLRRETYFDYDLGYRAFKIKIGRGLQSMPRKVGQGRDIAVTRAVRERFPDCRILVDANNGYTQAEFEGYVTAVADCDLYCIEEPFDENQDDYRQAARSHAQGRLRRDDHGRGDAFRGC